MTLPTVRLENTEPVSVAVIRRQASRDDLPRLVPDLCGQVWAALHHRHLHGGHNVVIYRDASILFEAGVECSQPFTDDPAIQFTQLPKGRTVVATHLGPYAKLFLAHQAILAWAKEQQLHLAGLSWERYGHWQPE